VVAAVAQRQQRTGDGCHACGCARGEDGAAA
jgi:hypothetical protein